MNKSTKIYVAMSGGVDSSVAALLLKQQGYDVSGVYMKNWSDPLADECPWEEDIKDFRAVCDHLGIPGEVMTFEEEYRRAVVDYLIAGYRKGITPNPDMLCNREIKFKVFLRHALSAGADRIATGHYARKTVDTDGQAHLLAGIDTTKDQSYFLALLNQRQLQRSLFPIGNYRKLHVRQIAKRAGLPVHDKKDSQGICFIGKVKFSDFIRQFIPARPGPIITATGQRIGEHDGLAFYTIGQRHGLKIGGGTPYFVVGKDRRRNALLVGEGRQAPQLFSREVYVRSFSWTTRKPEKFPVTCHARLRYRQPLQRCTVRKERNRFRVVFTKRQRAATPGQFAVLYKGPEVIGGGVIIGKVR